MNEQLVLTEIFANGPLSRVAIASLTGLSKPTVSSIVDQLVTAGLVEQDGRTSGGVGRTAALYRIDGAVGHVIGIDLGGTKARGMLCDLYGVHRAELSLPTETESADLLLDQLAALAHRLAREAQVDWGSVRALGLGVPGTVAPDTGQIGLAYNIPDLSEVNLTDELRKRIGNLEIVVENDVNAAAIGEHWQGRARDVRDFAFLAIGTGIGAGIVINGDLCRGRAGAAGEIGYLPFGTDPFDEAVDRRGALEAAVAGRGVISELRRQLESGQRSSLSETSSAADVFEAAMAGDAVAIAVLDNEARLVAMTIASLGAIVAPDLVILGGGIGSNELLLEPTRSYVGRLSVQPPKIDRSALGGRAAAIGALALGLEAARTAIFASVSNAELEVDPK